MCSIEKCSNLKKNQIEKMFRVENCSSLKNVQIWNWFTLKKIRFENCSFTKKFKIEICSKLKFVHVLKTLRFKKCFRFVKFSVLKIVQALKKCFIFEMSSFEFIRNLNYSDWKQRVNVFSIGPFQKRPMKPLVQATLAERVAWRRHIEAPPLVRSPR